MADLTDFARVGAKDSGLCVVSTLRADGTIQSSLVNAGVYEHPTTKVRGVAFVAMGGSRKLANLRLRPRITVVARSGWEWVAAEGNAELIGPDDPLAGIGPEELRFALREVFTAAGGKHDNWGEYDRAMVDERRTIVFVGPDRVYSNG